MECVYDVGVQDDHVPIVSMFFFPGFGREVPLRRDHVCRTMSREGGVHGVHKWGGVFWRWEGTTRVMGSVCVCVCLLVCGRWAMGRYERVQGNEVLTEGRWGGRWGRWSSGRGTDAAPAAAVPPGRWAESSSSASCCLLS